MARTKLSTQYQVKADPPWQPLQSGSNLIFSFIVATAQIFTQTIIYQDIADCPTPLESVTVDKWFNPLSEPKVKVKPREADFPAFTIGQPFVSSPDRWWANLAIPGPPKLLAKANYPFYTSGIEDTLEPGKTYEPPWHQPWSEPVRVKPGLSATQQQFYTSGIEDTLEPGSKYEPPWHQPWSEPVRLKRAINVDQPFVFAAETITVDKWFAALSERIRPKSAFTWQQQHWIGKLPVCVAGPTTLSPTDKSTSIALSDDNLMGTNIAGGDAYANARANRSHTYGNWYFEGRVHNVGPDGLLDNQGIGLANALEVLDGNRAGGSNNSVAVYIGHPGGDASIILNNVFFDLGATALPEQVIRIAVDLTHDKLWAQIAGVTFWNGSALADPATGVGGFDISAIVGPLFPIISTIEPADAIIVNFGSFNYPIPVGFQSWDTTETETVFLDKWYAPWREPVRVKPGLASSQQQFYTSGIEDTLEPGKTYESPWHQPWSDPPKGKPRTAEYQAFVFGSYSPIVKTADQWAQPWSEPPVKAKARTSEYQAFTYGRPPLVAGPDGWWQQFSTPGRIRPSLDTQQPFIFAAETITVDKWFVELSTPPKAKPRPVEFQAVAFGTYSPIVNTADQWWANLERPPRAAPRAAEYPSFTYGPVPIVQTTDRWWQPLAEPPKAKPRTSEFQAYTAPNFVEVVTIDKWLNQWSEPSVKSKAKSVEFPAFTIAPTQAQANDQIAWYRDLEIPPKAKPRTVEYPAYTSGIEDTLEPGATYESQYHQPWSDPPKAKPRTIEYQSFVYGPTPIVQTVDRWWRDFDPPPKAKPRTAEYQSYTAGFPSFENVTIDKWLISWSEPSVKTKLRAVEFPAFTYGPTPIVNNVDQWWQNFATPPKVKPRTADYLAFAIGPDQPEARDDIGWWVDLSTPPKAKPRSVEYLAFTYGPTPIVVPVDGWWANLATPPKGLPKAAEYPSLAFVGPSELITLDKWFIPYQDPVRPKGITVAQQRGFTAPDRQPQQFESEFHQPWTEPLVKVKLRTAEYQSLAFQQPPFQARDSIAWFAQLSEPSVKAKRRTAEYPQPVYGRPPLVSSPDRWWAPLAEPVRIRLRTTEYPFIAFSPRQPVAGKDTPSWYQALSEPLVKKKTMITAHQQWLAYNSLPLAATRQPFTKGYIIV